MQVSFIQHKNAHPNNLLLQYGYLKMAAFAFGYYLLSEVIYSAGTIQYVKDLFFFYLKDLIFYWKKLGQNHLKVYAFFGQGVAIIVAR